MQPIEDVLRFFCAGHLPSLDLVTDQPRQLVQSGVQQLRLKWGRVEDNLQSARVRLLDQIRQEVDLILQEQVVACVILRQRAVDLFLGLRPVRAAEQQDAVLAVPVDLNDRVAGRFIDGQHLCCVHTILRAGIQQHLTVRPNAPCQRRRRPSLGQCDRLIESLAAAALPEAGGSQRLARRNDVLDRVDVVQIERAVHQRPRQLWRSTICSMLDIHYVCFLFSVNRLKGADLSLLLDVSFSVQPMLSVWSTGKRERRGFGC